MNLNVFIIISENSVKSVVKRLNKCLMFVMMFVLNKNNMRNKRLDWSLGRDWMCFVLERIDVYKEYALIIKKKGKCEICV